MTINRRALLGGAGLILAAPAIVRVSSLMPVKVVDFSPQWLFISTIHAGGLQIGDRVFVVGIPDGLVITGHFTDGVFTVSPPQE